MNSEPNRQYDNETDTAPSAAPQGADPAPGPEQVADDGRPEAAAATADGPQQAAPGEDAAAPAQPDPDPDPAELTMLLEDARARVDQVQDQLLRTRAEMDNMSRRQAKELENAHKFALEGFVKELLQVRDSLELGHAAAQQPDADVVKLREGTELTLKLLGDVMSKFGVERVYPEGEPFNPDYHQAMSMQPRADLPANTVTNVVQTGYTLNGRLVRPALVMVSSAA